TRFSTSSSSWGVIDVIGRLAIPPSSSRDQRAFLIVAGERPSRIPVPGDYNFVGPLTPSGWAPRAADSVPLTTGPRLLPGEGAGGTYDNLIAAGSKGDNLTPHYIPSANRMALEGVSKADGIAINMEQPFPGVGGRHRATFTYGTQADINV